MALAVMLPLEAVIQVISVLLEHTPQHHKDLQQVVHVQWEDIAPWVRARQQHALLELLTIGLGPLSVLIVSHVTQVTTAQAQLRPTLQACVLLVIIVIFSSTVPPTGNLVLQQHNHRSHQEDITQKLVLHHLLPAQPGDTKTSLHRQIAWSLLLDIGQG